MKNNALCLKRSVTGRLPLTRALATFAAIALFAGCDLLFPDGGTNGGDTTPPTAREQYSVTYNGNSNTGGTAPSDTDVYLAGEVARVLLPDAEFAKAGFYFGGWTLAQDDDTALYSANDSFTVDRDMTFYAYWIPDSVTDAFSITYAMGTATGGSVPEDISRYINGQTAHLAWNEGVLTQENKAFAGWNTNSAGTGTSYKSGDSIIVTGNVVLYPEWSGSRTFWAYNMVNNTDYQITATPLGVTRHCIVYADTAENITAGTALSVAQEYENNVYQKMRDTYGKPIDVDNNDALIILLFDIIDGATEDSGYVAGYFYSGDMYDIASNPKSNQADMINMDMNPGDPGDADFNGTLAHELQHLINFSVTGGNSETWLNEGLSTSAEYVYSGTNEGSRVGDYNYSGDYTIAYGNNFFVWDGFWENLGNDSDLLSNYTTAYMFFQWLRVHASNDIGIYREILESGYGDYRAVTGVAESRINFKFSNWPTLMRTWYAANLCNDASGYYGYKGQLGPLEKWVVNPTGYDGTSLYPGEGIITANLVASFVPPVALNHIAYAGITEGALLTSSTLDSISPYTGTYTLALNGNTDVNGSAEPGYFPVASRSTSSRNIGAAIMTPKPGPVPQRGSYPIDVILGAEGIGR